MSVINSCISMRNNSSRIHQTSSDCTGGRIGDAVRYCQSELQRFLDMANNLQTVLYKAIVTLKSDLEADWAIGLRGNGYDLPTMAAGCEYAG